jgi:hypothetical protein
MFAFVMVVRIFGFIMTMDVRIVSSAMPMMNHAHEVLVVSLERRIVILFHTFGVGYSRPNHGIVKKLTSTLFALSLCSIDE